MPIIPAGRYRANLAKSNNSNTESYAVFVYIVLKVHQLDPSFGALFGGI